MVVEIPIMPAWLARETSIGANPYRSLQEAEYHLLPYPDDSPGYAEELAERVARRKLMDQKINDALAADFWEDDCDDLCSDTDDDDYQPSVGVKSLGDLAAEGVLEALSFEEKVGALGHLPTSFDTYRSMVEYQLDHKLNDLFLEARSDLQGSVIWHHQIAYEHGFEPQLISHAVRTGILEITNTQMVLGKSDLEAIRIAYKSMSMALLTLERLKCFLVPFIGTGRLIQCAEWAIENGQSALDKLSMPTIGELLRPESGRFVISYEMLATDVILKKENEMMALRNNACLIVGLNPFEVRILVERSSIGAGNWVEYSRQMKGDEIGRPLKKMDAEQLARQELADYLSSKKGKMKHPNEKKPHWEDDGDMRSLLGTARGIPRDVQMKVIHLQGRETIMIGVPNGKQLCWFPQSLPNWKVSGPTVADCDEIGIPCADYAKDMEDAEFLLDQLVAWLQKEGKPLLLEGMISNKLGEALSQLTCHPFHRSGTALVNLAVFMDILRDRNPGRGAQRLLEYTSGLVSPGRYACFEDADWDQPHDVGWQLQSEFPTGLHPVYEIEPGDLEFLQVKPH